MKTIKLLFILACCSIYATTHAQNIIQPGTGINEVKIGSSPDDVFWALGFKGLKLMKDGVPDVLDEQAKMLGVDFDYIHNYQHIMAYPVTTVFYKDDKAVLIMISSYPEYNQVLCMGMTTKEGLNFWDNVSDMKKTYGKDYETKESEYEYYNYKHLGISVMVDDKEIRSLSIFKPQ